MSNYDQSQHNRPYPPNAIDADGKGTGLVWAVIALVALGLLVLFASFGGGSGTAENPGDAGADATVVPVDPAPVPTDGTPAIE